LKGKGHLILAALLAFSSGFFLGLVCDRFVGGANARQEVASASMVDVIRCTQGRGILLDARKKTSFNWGHIAGAISIPQGDLASISRPNFAAIMSSSNIVVYCEGIDCGSSYFAAYKLAQSGVKNIKVYNGGWDEWVSCRMPVIKATD